MSVNFNTNPHITQAPNLPVTTLSGSPFGAAGNVGVGNKEGGPFGKSLTVTMRKPTVLDQVNGPESGDNEQLKPDAIDNLVKKILATFPPPAMPDFSKVE